ncbi:uncharacterized, partial [Tachysurus ichikawai]
TQLTPLAPCIRCALIEEKNNAVWCSVRYMEWVVEGKRRVSAARKLPAHHCNTLCARSMVNSLMGRTGVLCRILRIRRVSEM